VALEKAVWLEPMPTAKYRFVGVPVPPLPSTPTTLLAATVSSIAEVYALVR